MRPNKFKLIYIPVALMLLISTVIIGLPDYITMNFSKEVLQSADWWTNIISTNAGILCVILSILLMRIDQFKSTNEEYLRSTKRIYDFYCDKYVAPVFKKFCYEDNLKTKIICYKNKVNKQFTKVKPTKEDLVIFYSGTPEEKEKNEYCKKMVYYDSILSAEYINRVVPKLHIKYNPISESLIFTGVATKSADLDYVTKHKAFKIFIDLLPKFLLSFGISILMASLIPDLRQGITWVTVFKTVMKLFTLLAQIYFSYNYADRYNREVTLHDVIFRESKLNEYEVWENRQLSKIKGEGGEQNG